MDLWAGGVGEHSLEADPELADLGFVVLLGRFADARDRFDVGKGEPSRAIVADGQTTVGELELDDACPCVFGILQELINEVCVVGIELREK